MVKTLQQVGNSQALVIPKAILDLLKIDRLTPLEITTDGVGLLIRPKRMGRGAQVDAALDQVLERRDDTLRKLADS